MSTTSSKQVRFRNARQVGPATRHPSSLTRAPSRALASHAGERLVAVDAVSTPEEQLRTLVRDAVTLPVSAARAGLPQMMRRSAQGVAFVIAHARRRDDPGTLLMSPTTFLKVLEDRETALLQRPGRTMGELIDALPFSGTDLPAPRSLRLPGAGRTPAQLPD